ncbi:MAG: hypothetical protein QM612_03835 [Thermomonas sp.]|uniref:hypothetical protein n=1 Tax=Thermomonas sp. TaxID=1971895 RepID=UPI0039E66195
MNMANGMGAGWRRVAAPITVLIAVLALVLGCSRPPAEVATEAVALPQAQGVITVAVLPLVAQGDIADASYLTDGLAEHLAGVLARMPGVTVVSTDSSFQFRDASDLNSVVGDKLGATHLVRGSMQRQDDKLRIELSLLRTSDGQPAWTQRYESPYSGLFAVQDEIATALANALQVKWDATDAQDDRPPGGSLQAYEAVLKGNEAYRGADIFSARQAVDAYRRAVEIDPDYAYAHARLAQARIQQVTRFPLGAEQDREQGEQARRDAAAAMRLAPNSAESHRANAAWLGGIALDPSGAMDATRRALALAPQDAGLLTTLAVQQTAFGQLREAAETLRHALKLNPLSAPTLFSLGGVYLGMADYPQAEHVLRQALALQPDITLANALLAIAVFQQNRPAEAVEIARREPVPLWRSYALAMAHWANGERAASDAQLQVLVREHADEGATQIAGIHAQRDDEDAVFHWLDVARKTGDPGIVEIRYMPFVSRYAEHPRFVALAREIGLVQQAVTKKD